MQVNIHLLPLCLLGDSPWYAGLSQSPDSTTGLLLSHGLGFVRAWGLCMLIVTWWHYLVLGGTSCLICNAPSCGCYKGHMGMFLVLGFHLGWTLFSLWHGLWIWSIPSYKLRSRRPTTICLLLSWGGSQLIISVATQNSGSVTAKWQWWRSEIIISSAFPPRAGISLSWKWWCCIFMLTPFGLVQVDFLPCILAVSKVATFCSNFSEYLSWEPLCLWLEGLVILASRSSHWRWLLTGPEADGGALSCMWPHHSQSHIIIAIKPLQ